MNTTNANDTETYDVLAIDAMRDGIEVSNRTDLRPVLWLTPRIEVAS